MSRISRMGLVILILATTYYQVQLRQIAAYGTSDESSLVMIGIVFMMIVGAGLFVTFE